MPACEICKITNSLHQNIIYQDMGRTTPIQLCHAHDQELYLMGQFRFVKKYHSLLHSSFHLKESERKKRDDAA
jgi:hypothetical protein